MLDVLSVDQNKVGLVPFIQVGIWRPFGFPSGLGRTKLTANRGRRMPCCTRLRHILRELNERWLPPKFSQSLLLRQALIHKSNVNLTLITQAVFYRCSEFRKLSINKQNLNNFFLHKYVIFYPPRHVLGALRIIERGKRCSKWRSIGACASWASSDSPGSDAWKRCVNGWPREAKAKRSAKTSAVEGTGLEGRGQRICAGQWENPHKRSLRSRIRYPKNAVRKSPVQNNPIMRFA